MPRFRLAVLLFFISAAFACSRAKTNEGADAASLDATAAPTPSPSSSVAMVDHAYADLVAIEAKRVITGRIDDARQKAHFLKDGGALPSSFEVQSVDLAIQGRRAILVAEAAKGATEARPFLYVAEADGTIVWSKDRPHAGITPPVGQLVLGAGPRGRVSQAACDPPTTTVALRIWDYDGFPFADFQALKVEGCDELALMYWPKRGFLIVAARSGATTAQLIDEEGKLTWSGTRGIELGTRAKIPMPPSLVADRMNVKRDEQSFLLVQGGSTAEGQMHLYAFRYDLSGVALWQAALDLGPIAQGTKERTALRRVEDGVVAATLPGGKQIEIRSSGESRAR